jgi:hypothetical protein
VYQIFRRAIFTDPNSEHAFKNVGSSDWQANKLGAAGEMSDRLLH